MNANDNRLGTAARFECNMICWNLRPKQRVQSRKRQVLKKVMNEYSELVNIQCPDRNVVLKRVIRHPMSLRLICTQRITVNPRPVPSPLKVHSPLSNGGL